MLLGLDRPGPRFVLPVVDPDTQEHVSRVADPHERSIAWSVRRSRLFEGESDRVLTREECLAEWGAGRMSYREVIWRESSRPIVAKEPLDAVRVAAAGMEEVIATPGPAVKVAQLGGI